MKDYGPEITTWPGRKVELAESMWIMVLKSETYVALWHWEHYPNVDLLLERELA